MLKILTLKNYMKTTQKLAILILLCITVQNVIAQELNSSHSAKDYTIQFPESWRLDTSGQMNTEFILFSPISNNKDDFSENINVLIQDLSEYNMTFEDYIETSLNQVNTLVPSSKIYEKGKVTKGGIPYYKMVYSGYVAERMLKFKQYFYVIDQKAYVLTFTATTESFDEYVDLGTNILDSFKFNQ